MPQSRRPCNEEDASFQPHHQFPINLPNPQPRKFFAVGMAVPESLPSTGHSTPPTSPSQLPAEALNLASTLFTAAREGNEPVLKQYLQAGLAPNLTNSAGDTLLMLASYHGNLPTVRTLLAHGADANALNGRGQSILAGAVFKGHEEVVRVLIEDGKADVTLGQPNAVASGKLFKREACLRLMGVPEDEWQRGIEGMTVPGPPT